MPEKIDLIPISCRFVVGLQRLAWTAEARQLALLADADMAVVGSMA
jgi:hypothetical protein